LAGGAEVEGAGIGITEPYELASDRSFGGGVGRHKIFEAIDRCTISNS
jgi:hypothetical protein